MADSTQLLFFNQGEPCRFSHPIPGGDDCTAIAFEESALHAFLIASDPTAANRRPHQPFSRPVAAASPHTALLLQRLRQHLFLGQGASTLVAEETAASLLGLSLHAAGRRPAQRTRRADTRRAHRELAHRARLVVAANYRQKLTLSALAGKVFSSPFHLARIFRQETGQSLHGYVLRLRLQAALERVVHQPAADLTALALDVGFTSHAHLSDTFRRVFGLAPSCLRHRASKALLKALNRRLRA